MELALTYGAPSGVSVGGGRTRVQLSGARERPAVKFRGSVREPIAFREALSALHDVVISDFRWEPPAARAEFEQWLAAWVDRRAEGERARPDAQRRRFLRSFFEEERQLKRVVLDPVCSVHPDQVSFEGFSKDGSSYARVGLDRSGFEESGETVCGTTNVDFSAGLYEAVRRLRSIWKSELDLTPAAVAVKTEAKTHTEKKIDLPDPWVRGFLQIGSAFLLEAVNVELLPIHVHDICRFLRLHRARVSPRALRWELHPEKPAVLVIEPWEHRMTLLGSRHGAREPRIIRIWGRQRLVLVERVLPLARSFVVSLLGRGLPYFVTARMGALDFTLGLSGWTKNDWTQTARFDALVARRGTKAASSPRPLAWLKEHFRGTPEEIAQGAGVSVATVQASMVEASALGLAVYDLLHEVYRYRPLFENPVPVARDPREVRARELLARTKVVGTRRELDGTLLVRGQVVEDEKHTFLPEVALADEGGVARATCGCYFAKSTNMKEGLCEHEHALLLSFEE
jgi:hypothetical protein